MTTILEFRGETIIPLSKYLEPSLAEELSRRDAVPIYGLIRYFGGDGEDSFTGYHAISLASENGDMVMYDGVYQFDDAELIHRTSDLLGIDRRAVSVAFGREPYEDAEHPDYDCHVRWHFLYTDAETFEAAAAKAKASVISENDPNGRPTWRCVAPKPIRIKNAKFPFDPGKAMVRFVSINNNSIEYETDDGLRVIDNRRGNHGWVYGDRRTQIISMYGPKDHKDGSARRMTTRAQALKNFIGNHTEGTDAVREVAGQALCELVELAEMSRYDGGLIAAGMEALCGKPYVPLRELLTNTGGGDFREHRRMLLKTAEVSAAYEDAMDPRYVVFTDRVH